MWFLLLYRESSSTFHCHLNLTSPCECDANLAAALIHINVLYSITDDDLDFLSVDLKRKYIRNRFYTWFTRPYKYLPVFKNPYWATTLLRYLDLNIFIIYIKKSKYVIIQHILLEYTFSMWLFSQTVFVVMKSKSVVYSYWLQLNSDPVSTHGSCSLMSRS